MSDYSDLIPANLKRSLSDGTNLKPSITTPLYSGGTPSAANEIKPSICYPDGTLKPSIADANGLKPSWLADAPEATLWTPAALSPLMWMSAANLASIHESSGLVSQWDDLSGNGNHLVNPTGSEQPLWTSSYQLNGVDLIYFDGTNKRLRSDGNPFGASISNATVYMVVEVVDNVFGAYFNLTTGSPTLAERWTAQGANTGFDFDVGGSSSPNRISNGSYGPSSGDFILGCTCQTSLQLVRIDGSDFLSDATGHSVSVSANLNIGRSGSSYKRMALAELIIINDATTSDERDQIEGYLAHQWGLASNLPGGHPYKSEAPAT